MLNNSFKFELVVEGAMQLMHMRGSSHQGPVVLACQKACLQIGKIALEFHRVLTYWL